MTPEASLWSFISDASVTVKVVLAILFCASIASWAIILQKILLFKKVLKNCREFEKTFWTGDLNKIYQSLAQVQGISGLQALFHDGYKEFRRANDLEITRRAMRIVQTKEIADLEKQLPFLATVGSISPYVGLFGTVWGIMNSFRALGTVQQASIAMVAPGIAEALIATAVGLFAAIPAVIAYNRFSQRLDQCQQHYEIFQEELLNIFQRHLTTKKENYATVN